MTNYKKGQFDIERAAMPSYAGEPECFIDLLFYIMTIVIVVIVIAIIVMIIIVVIVVTIDSYIQGEGSYLEKVSNAFLAMTEKEQVGMMMMMMTTMIMMVMMLMLMMWMMRMMRMMITNFNLC